MTGNIPLRRMSSVVADIREAMPTAGFVAGSFDHLSEECPDRNWVVVWNIFCLQAILVRSFCMSIYI